MRRAGAWPHFEVERLVMVVLARRRLDGAGRYGLMAEENFSRF